MITTRLRIHFWRLGLPLVRLLVTGEVLHDLVLRTLLLMRLLLELSLTFPPGPSSWVTLASKMQKSVT